jgi:Xaa-Pro aminopeptidase
MVRSNLLLLPWTQLLSGIGLEVHEAPYLNGGNDVILQQGHAFSNEPGIYIEGEVCDS